MFTQKHSHERRTRSILVVLVLTLTATTFACKVPNPEFDEVDETGSDDGSTIPGVEPGQWYCAHFPQPPGALAYYEAEDPPDDYQDILTEGSTGNQPSACRCAHPDLDTLLQEHISLGQLYIDADVINDWDDENPPIPGEGPLNFREALFGELSDDCEHLADTWHGNRDDDNCQTTFTTLDHDEIVILRDTETCTAWITYGEEPNMVPLPVDGWSDYYTLGSVITYNSGLNLYTINGAFFNDMLQNPAWIIDDGAYVDLNGSNYQLYNVTSGTIAHALGLQSGDIPLTLNSIDISTMDGVMDAWTTLQTETEFELVVLRGTNSVTLDYFVAHVL